MKRKILTTAAIVMCALLLVAGSIAGTLAYLTSQAKVQSTFTVGNVAISLWENGNEVTAETGGTLHLVPSVKYDKVTQIKVAQNSEDCYLFVKLENGLFNITDTATIEAQMYANGWRQLTVNSVEIDNVYYYTKDEESVVARNTAADTTVNVFEYIKINNTVDNATLSDYITANITVTAYAIQADGLDTVSAAWTASNFGA